MCIPSKLNVMSEIAFKLIFLSAARRRSRRATEHNLNGILLCFALRFFERFLNRDTTTVGSDVDADASTAHSPTFPFPTPLRPAPVSLSAWACVWVQYLRVCECGFFWRQTVWPDSADASARTAATADVDASATSVSVCLACLYMASGNASVCASTHHSPRKWHWRE